MELSCMTSESFHVVAAFEYQEVPGQHCISLAPGQEIEVLRWNRCGWWWGRRVDDGREGWFPSTFVQPAKIAGILSAASVAGEAGPVKAVGEVEGSPSAAARNSERGPVEPAVTTSGSPGASMDVPFFPPLPPAAPVASSHVAGSLSLTALEPKLVHKPGGLRPPGLVPAIVHGGLATVLCEELPETREPALANDYLQSLPRLPDGRFQRAVVPPEDRGCRQLKHFFDYEKWVDGMNLGNSERSSRPTGDGGLKRRRC